MEPGLRNTVMAELGHDERSSNDEKLKAQPVTQERVTGCAFILGADRGRFGKLIEDLKNSHTQGTDKCTKDLTMACKLLVNWKQDPRNQIQVIRTPGPSGSSTRTGETAFTNVGDTGSETHCLTTAGASTGDKFPDMRCHACQQMGHCAGSCPNTAPRGAGNRGTMETCKELGVLPEDGVDLQETDPRCPPERTC